MSRASRTKCPRGGGAVGDKRTRRTRTRRTDTRAADRCSRSQLRCRARRPIVQTTAKGRAAHPGRPRLRIGAAGPSFGAGRDDRSCRQLLRVEQRAGRPRPSRCRPGTMWPWTSRVMAFDEWPSRSDMTFGCMPVATAGVAGSHAALKPDRCSRTRLFASKPSGTSRGSFKKDGGGVGERTEQPLGPGAADHNTRFPAARQHRVHTSCLKVKGARVRGHRPTGATRTRRGNRAPGHCLPLTRPASVGQRRSGSARTTALTVA